MLSKKENDWDQENQKVELIQKNSQDEDNNKSLQKSDLFKYN